LGNWKVVLQDSIDNGAAAWMWQRILTRFRHSNTSCIETRVLPFSRSTLLLHLEDFLTSLLPVAIRFTKQPTCTRLCNLLLHDGNSTLIISPTYFHPSIASCPSGNTVVQTKVFVSRARTERSWWARGERYWIARCWRHVCKSRI